MAHQSPSPKQLGPSPLQQVHLSEVEDLEKVIPSSEKAPDAVFWRRFSAAVHRSESADLEKGRGASGDVDIKEEWLAQQYRKKRKCRIMCLVITLAVIVAVAAVVVAIYYVLKIRK